MTPLTYDSGLRSVQLAPTTEGRSFLACASRIYVIRRSSFIIVSVSALEYYLVGFRHAVSQSDGHNIYAVCQTRR